MIAAGLLAWGLSPSALIGDDAPGRSVRSVDPVAVTVEGPAAGQEALARRKEHCSADAGLLGAIGVEPGRQVRIEGGGAGGVLFTVAEARDEGGLPVVRIGDAGRRRLGGPDEASPLTISAAVTRSDLSDQEARDLGEVVERLDDDGSQTGLIVLAPHGGLIEVQTDRQAERVRDRLDGRPVSAWRCLGYGARGGLGAFDRWHITSTDIHEASFPLLGRLADRRFDHAVSFHGMAREGVLIGGAAPTRLKVEVRDAIRAVVDDAKIPVDVALPGDSLGGTSPRNIVNRYCPGGGVQIEQGPRARREHWEAIADAVAEVFGARL